MYNVRGRKCVTINTAMIILAAGLSDRMGVLKPLLPVGEEPAILRCIRAAQNSGVRDIVVVTGHGRADLERALRLSADGVKTVYNCRYYDGMFSSVHAGVSVLDGKGIDGFFILPADCCAVSHEMLETLKEHFERNRASAVIRPKYGTRRGHPPLIPARHIAGLRAYSGENGLKGFLSALPTVEIEMKDSSSLLDMDTPEDYVALLEHLGLPAYPEKEQCNILLKKYNAPQGVIEHGRQVANLAVNFAQTLPPPRLCLPLLVSACLLHDIKRTEPDHAKAAMNLLLTEGYPKTALLVGSHMDLPEHPSDDIGELELLYLADKLCRRGKVVSLEETEREIEKKFSSDKEALVAAKRRISHAIAIQHALRTVTGTDFLLEKT